MTAKKKAAGGKGKAAKRASSKTPVEVIQGDGRHNVQVSVSSSHRAELPPGWARTTVDESVTIIDYRGRTPPFDGSEIPHLRSQNIKSGQVIWEDLVHVSERTYAAFMTRGIPRTGDLLFTTEAPLGEVAPIPGHRFSVAQRVMILRPSVDTWHPPFLMYQLMSPDVQARLRLRGTGSTVTGVSSRNFKPMELRVAPLSEQRKVVAEIEKQFTRLDVGVAALKRVQANLKRYRAAVLKAACEGRLVPTEAELARTEKRKAKFETGEELLARILKERRNNWQGRGGYKEPVGPDTAKLQLLPEGWTWATAEQLCGFITKGTTPSSEKMQGDCGEVPFIKVYNLTFTGRLNMEFKPVFVSRSTHAGELARSEVRPWDVLINIVGPPLGQVALVPLTIPVANMNQAVARFRAVLPGCATYVATALMSERIMAWAIRQAKTTAGQSNLTLELCRELPIPLPPIAEQSRIVAEVERRLSVVEELDTVVSKNLLRSSRLRQSILQDAFVGRLATKEIP